MNYLWQLYGVSKSSTTGHKFGVLDYSNGTMEPIDENSLEESLGLGSANELTPFDTGWKCPGPNGQQIRGHTPTGPLDFNCDGNIQSGPQNLDLTHDGHLTVLNDHNDWSSLTFDAGGALGGAGDAENAAETTENEEPTVKSLSEGAPDFQTVALSSPGQITTQSQTAAPVSISITNNHPVPQTYQLAVRSSGVTIVGVPSQITLGGSETRALTATMEAGPASATAFFEIDATSETPTDAASATSEVHVVDAAVPDEPRPGSDGVLLSANNAVLGTTAGSAPPRRSGLVVVNASGGGVRVRIDHAKPSTLSHNAITNSVELRPTPHTVTILSRTGRVLKSSRLTAKAGQLVTVEITGTPLDRHIRIISINVGARTLLSLVSGILHVMPVGHGSQIAVHYGHPTPLRQASTTIRIARRTHVIPPGAQLVVLIARGRSVATVTRAA
jgi:hypothetical protein